MEVRRGHPASCVGGIEGEAAGQLSGRNKQTDPTYRERQRLGGGPPWGGNNSGATNRGNSDAKGSFLNESIWGETIYRETSYSNDGLADPGHLALIRCSRARSACSLAGEHVSTHTHATPRPTTTSRLLTTP